VTIGSFNAEAEALKNQPAPAENQALTSTPAEGFPLKSKDSDGNEVSLHTSGVVHAIDDLDNLLPNQSEGVTAAESASTQADYAAFARWKKDQETKVQTATDVSDADLAKAQAIVDAAKAKAEESEVGTTTHATDGTEPYEGGDK
jgi:hypothetical protein